jgi:hypothetical protein
MINLNLVLRHKSGYYNHHIAYWDDLTLCVFGVAASTLSNIFHFGFKKSVFI